jgi:succinyl-diaminopimelate desuccinylase
VLDLTAGAVDITRTICDIESVSGAEGELADAVEHAVRALPHLTVERFGNTVVARTMSGRPHRVALAGHLDTVPVHDNLPSRFETDGGIDWLWGRGTVDMKAGVAVQLALAARLVEPRYDLTWLWYDCEEVESARNGLNLLAAHRPDLLQADFAILGEPSAAQIEGGCNGTLRVDVRTTGVRAHSARPWMGENAIHKAAPILARLAGYTPREVEVDGLVYRESLNAVRIAGGVATNVIPDECVVHVNYRFAPSRTGAEAVAHLREVFEGFDVGVADLAEGARPGLDTPFAAEFLTAVGAVAKPKYGWTDVARFAALGIPAVNYGPGDPSKAHADDERVALAQITACEAGLLRWLT